VRYTLTATVLAGAAFAIGGSVALTYYHDSLVANANHDALGVARSLAATDERAPLPNPIPMPVAAGVPRVQVLDASNTVVSGDPVSALSPPLFVPTQGDSGRVIAVNSPARLPEHRAAIAVLEVQSPTGSVTVLVAQSLDPADAKARQAVELSAVLGALSLVVIGAVAWLAVGRTLRRVERLRTQAATITSTGDLGHRLPMTGHDELSDLGTTLNDMLAELSKSAERQRRFVADAAHELRTPLAGLSASLQIAISHPDTTRDAGWLSELADGHRRLARLVNDLLVLAALDGHAPQHRRDLDLAGVIIDATRRATLTGVHLRVGPIDRAVVSGDETQLARIVTNLLDNALRHASSTVTVTLSTDTGTETGHAVMTVTDDGPGIPTADQERIWQRFVRLDQDRSRPTGGSGLGLALVNELTEAHHGTITLTSPDHGSGARFTVRLPLQPDPTRSTGSGAQPPPSRPGGSAGDRDGRAVATPMRSTD
jgi:signal transduction histidine kinase